MEYILSFLYTVFFIFIFYKIPFYTVKGLSIRGLSAIFILKIVAGIGMSWLYTYYYTDRNTADIFKYFDDSKVMFDALFDKPLDYLSMITGIGNDSNYFNEHYYKVMNNWYRIYESNLYNESHTIIRFNAIIRIFSFGYYNVHTVFICFLSLTGLLAMYKIASNFIKGKSKELILGVFLLPSVIFWGSGVLKEGLLFFGLGMLVYNFRKISIKFGFISLLWILACCLLLFYTKFYIFIITIPILISHFWVVKTNNSYSLLKYLAVFALFLVAGLNLHYVFNSFDFLDILVTKQRDFIALAKSMNSGSLINIKLLTPDIWSFLINAPLAFFNTFMRPFIFEADSILILMAALENLFILIITLLALFFFDFRNINKNNFYACAFSVILLFILIGLITPVMGAMVRYKVPALPFLMILLIMLIDKEKMIKKMPFLKFLKEE